ncbi:MAG TPA: hypothetical protein VHC69_06835 [Polyangiaceae bacterium]|nr:hypothetical protein [Polyangiaceae bacterium]
MPRPKSEGVVAQLPDGRYKVRVTLADGSYSWHTLKKKCSEARARSLGEVVRGRATRRPPRHEGAARRAR